MVIDGIGLYGIVLDRTDGIRFVEGLGSLGLFHHSDSMNCIAKQGLLFPS